MTSRTIMLLLALSAACAACARGDAAQAIDTNGSAAPTDTAVAIAATAVPREPGALRTVLSAPVHGRTGPDGQPFEVALRTPGTAPHARRFGTRTLPIGLRSAGPSLGQYPCTSCHMGRGLVLRDERIADAHGDIQPSHPRETGATCATCHAEDDVGLLALRNGERATLDHAYRVCAQCHFPQADAWAAGAHGKRLDGWQGRRVVMGCTDCHDPHAPALEMRRPFRPPLLHRPGSRQR
jgi:hypothetical protein